MLCGKDNIACLTLCAAQRLVNHNLAVGKRVAFALRAGGKKERAHRRGQADRNGTDIALDIIHRVENRHAVGNAAARAVDVQRDVLMRIARFEINKLSDDIVCKVGIDFAAQKDNSVFEKP